MAGDGLENVSGWWGAWLEVSELFFLRGNQADELLRV